MLQSYPQVLKGLNAGKAQGQGFRPVLSPSLGCQFLGNFPPVCGQVEPPNQLLLSQMGKWTPQATSPRSEREADLRPDPASL